MEKVKESAVKNELIETLQNAVDAENMMQRCCGYLASLIKNGKIRNRFNSLSEDSKKNKEFLMNRLLSLGINKYLPEEHCRFCNIKAESFSLLGAINLGLEVIDIEIKLYKDLLRLADNADKELFNKILSEKVSQKTFLKNEKKFIHEEEYRLSLINSHCIPEIISKLAK